MEFHEQIEDRPGKRGSLNPQKISVTEIFVARHGKTIAMTETFYAARQKILRDGDFLMTRDGDFFAVPDNKIIRNGDYLPRRTKVLRHGDFLTCQTKILRHGDF